MSSLDESLQRISGVLKTLGKPFALVGGLAVSVRSEPRFTRDADLAVTVNDDADAESLVFDLRRNGYEVIAAVEQEATGRLATIRLVEQEDDGSMVIDLLLASSGIEPDVVSRADELEVLWGVVLPVATVGDLLALKVLSRDDVSRPTDLADLRALGQVATDADWTSAISAAGDIETRGYARGRDLRTALASIRDGD